MSNSWSARNSAVTAKMLWLEMIIQTNAYAGAIRKARVEVIMLTPLGFYLGNRRRVFAHPFY